MAFNFEWGRADKGGERNKAQKRNDEKGEVDVGSCARSQSKGVMSKKPMPLKWDINIWLICDMVWSITLAFTVQETFFWLVCQTPTCVRTTTITHMSALNHLLWLHLGKVDMHFNVSLFTHCVRGSGVNGTAELIDFQDGWVLLVLYNWDQLSS